MLAWPYASALSIHYSVRGESAQKRHAVWTGESGVCGARQAERAECCVCVDGSMRLDGNGASERPKQSITVRKKMVPRLPPHKLMLEPKP
jgi:hypothetical protein